jgi:cell wall-associated NlpC family hydrolase
VPNGRVALPARAATKAALAVSSVLVIGIASLGLSAAADPRPTLAEVQAQVDDLNHQAEQATERYNAATDELAEVQRRLDAATADVARQQAKVTELTKDMGGFAAASYRTGGMDPTMQVFLAEDPTEFLAQASVVDAYASQQAGALRTVAVERQRLAEQEAAAADEEGRLARVGDRLETEQQEIERKLAEAQRLLDSLEAEQRAQLERDRAARDEASRSAARAATDALPAVTGDVAVSGRAGQAVAFALAQVGKPYSWGATGPSAYDCSGLTLAAWASAGVSLPRSSSAQYGAGTRVSRSELQPGDLVFYYSPISHVAMYIGGGQIVHATHPGSPVQVDPVGLMPYSGATRVG